MPINIKSCIITEDYDLLLSMTKEDDTELSNLITTRGICWLETTPPFYMSRINNTYSIILHLLYDIKAYLSCGAIINKYDNYRDEHRIVKFIKQMSIAELVKFSNDVCVRFDCMQYKHSIMINLLHDNCAFFELFELFALNLKDIGLLVRHYDRNNLILNALLQYELMQKFTLSLRYTWIASCIIITT